MFRTDYAGHEAKYRRLRAEGKTGWAEDYAEILADLDRLLRGGHAPTKGRLLELGCGAGNISLWLAERGFDVHGVDISVTAIDWARDRANKLGLIANFRVGNVLDLDGYEDGSFDFVLDGLCFHCIIGGDRKLFLANALRVLKPRGHFLAATMCGKLPQGFDPESRCQIVDGVARRYVGLSEDILKEIAAAGFGILRWEVRPGKGPDDTDTLIVDAEKPKGSGCG